MNVINPWEYTSTVDYQRLFDDFGISRFDELLKRIKYPHRYMRRGIIFGHRSYDSIVDAMNSGKPFSAMSGFMPSGRVHLGHKMVMEEIIWHQQHGGTVFMAVADMEAHSVRGISWKECRRIGVEEYILSLIALGFKPEGGYIYFQSTSSEVRDLAFELGVKANFSELSAIYGFNGETNIAHMVSATLQSADILHPQLEKFGGPRPVVIPVGADQDPHIRLTRGLADKINMFGINVFSRDDPPLFSWDEIPGNDDKRFIEFLKDELKIEWVKTEDISKIDDGKTIIVSNKEKSLSLKLSNEKTKVNLKIDDDRVYKFTVKKENGKLNIYNTVNFVSIYLKLPAEQIVEQKYLFSWDEIPGNDGKRFIEFLKDEMKIEWVKTKNISKIDDGKTIIVSNKEKSLSLKLSNEKTKVNLKIDDDRVYKFTVKKENGKLNIYEQKNQKIFDDFEKLIEKELTDDDKINRYTGHMNILCFSSDYKKIQRKAQDIARKVISESGRYAFMPPASTYHKFMTGLQGGKMSSSIPDSIISLTEEPKIAAKKIMRAKTGGRITLDEQKKKGGVPDECTVFELMWYHLIEDDEEVMDIKRECKDGKLMCGVCKKKAAALMEEFLIDHQKKREAARDILDQFNLY